MNYLLVNVIVQQFGVLCFDVDQMNSSITLLS